MKIWTEIESLKEVAQLGLESSISLMVTNYLVSNINFFPSFSWVFNFGNPLSSSCDHRKSPDWSSAIKVILMVSVIADLNERLQAVMYAVL